MADENPSDTGGQSSPVPDVVSGASNTSTGTVQEEPNTRFLTNILYENSGSVYGLEVLLFDIDDNPIETILVVDETSFNSWTELTKQLKGICAPYTKADGLLMDEVLSEREKVGKVKSDGYTYTYQDFLDYLKELDESGKWSNLKQLGSLEDVLKNTPTPVTDDNGATSYQYPVEINATKFMDMTSDKFSKVGHEHNYAERLHSSTDTSYGVGDGSKYGHVKVVDNLSTTSYLSGEALSAYQGKILNDKITDVKNNKNKWDAYITISKPSQYNGSWKYKVNRGLRLVVCNCDIENFTGLASKTGSQELLPAGTIPNAYAPSARVTTSMYRGDVVLYYNRDGSVMVHNLTKLKTINLKAQVMWHY